jgi:hypothetical protein
MPRRIPDYPDAYAGWNALSSFGSYISVVGICCFFVVVAITSSSGKNKRCAESPWTVEQNPTTLEWLVQSPPAFHTFGELPTIKETENKIERKVLLFGLLEGRFSYLTGTIGKSGLFPISPNLFFFLKISAIFLFYFHFLFMYQIMFPGKDPRILPNPLLVITQLSCFYFFYKKRGDAWKKHLCLLHLFCSINCNLYLQGLPISFLFFFFFIFLFCVLCFPLEQKETAIFILLSFHCADPHLSEWGFLLVFQQFVYWLFSLFLEEEKNAFIFERFFSFTILLLAQFFLGLLYYHQFYINEPLRFASLLSETCIIFFCLRERTTWEFCISFIFYFFSCSYIALNVSPTSTTTMWGVPSGIFLFLILHFWFLLILIFIFLERGSIKGKHPLIPIFFAIIFLIIPHLPGVEWLERWIEGMDLFLLLLSLLSLLDQKGQLKRRR